MHTLKRFFITPYSIGVMFAAVHSLVQVFTLGVSTTWSAAAIATVPAALFFAKVFITDTARTSKYAPLLWGSGALGCLLLLMLKPAGLIPVAYALGWGLLGSLLYDFWFSRYQSRDKTTLAVGKSLPEFQLQDSQGNIVSSQKISESPALLLFYRGNWCPLCMAQIKEVAAQYQQLAQRGVKTYLISNQSANNTRKLAEKFSVPMDFLVDQDLAAAKSLGIVAKGGTPAGLPGYDADTNLPTVVMTDGEGKIIFADLTDNYRVRPEPETFLKILDQHKISTT